MNPLTTLTILWSVLATSQLIYLVLYTVVGGPSAPQDAGFLNTMTASLGIVSLIQGVGAIVYFRRAAVAAVQARRLDPTTPPGAARLFPVAIICWVLAESIAIYGFVLRFLTAPLTHSIGFALAAFLLLYAMRPWQQGLKPPLSSAELARSPGPIR